MSIFVDMNFFLGVFVGILIMISLVVVGGIASAKVLKRMAENEKYARAIWSDKRNKWIIQGCFMRVSERIGHCLEHEPDKLKYEW